MKIEVRKFRPFTFEGVEKEISPYLNDHEKNIILELLNEYGDCFATALNEVDETDDAKMARNLSDNTPVTYRPYRMALSEKKKVRDIVHGLIDNGIVRESNPPYASPILLVRKKNEEERLCLDYQAVNRKTIKNR
ncbi:hypothetical protein JTB14_017281 [Gonioctena quinquepunctata]|nr:hypothetical protein JTB14_017281 [Gonioctena quinquepunctata]